MYNYTDDILLCNTCLQLYGTNVQLLLDSHMLIMYSKFMLMYAQKWLYIIILLFMGSVIIMRHTIIIYTNYLTLFYRDTVMSLLKQLNPEATTQRKIKRLKRRIYKVMD